MSKNNWWKLGLVSVLAVGLLMVIGLTQDEIKNPDTIITATIGETATLDPAWHYDTSSATKIFNIYDTLIFYDREKVNKFVPSLSLVVPTFENGLIYIGPDEATYYAFPMRTGVKFHEGGTLTPEDAEYSLERGMLQDRSGGPQWMILKSVLGVAHIAGLVEEIAGVPFEEAPEEALVEACERVKESITVEPETNSVVIRTVAPVPFWLQILAGSWGAVLDKEWVIEQGGWDGTCDNWVKWHDPERQESVLYDKANGTGPYKLERWDPGVEFVFTRNDGYWRETPIFEGGPSGPAKVKTVIEQIVPEWGTRRLMLEEGDADYVYVPRAYIEQVEALVNEEIVGPEYDPEKLTVKNPEGTVRLFKGYPVMASADIFFNSGIVTKGNPHVYSGKLDGQGIPSDFFADINVRKAFNYSFDWDTFISDACLGECVQRRGPIPDGVAYFNPDNPVYSYDPEQAEQFFKKAWDGQVWEKGFKFDILYNTGNDMRRIAAEILERNIEALNPKFKIDVKSVEWPTYLDQLIAGSLSLFIIGWLEDYHDADNWVDPYMASTGTFMGFQGEALIQLAKEKYDPLIDEARTTLDKERRKELYFELQRLAYEDAIDIFETQPTGRHYEQMWMRGWFDNTAFPGAYFYYRWKGTGPYYGE